MPEEFSLFDGESVVAPAKQKRATDPEVSAAARTLAQVRGRVKGAAQATADASLGIERAEKHANRVTPEWSARADAIFMEYARMFPYAEFLTERVRDFAKTQGLPDAPDGRAWGAVPRRLMRLGKIEQGAPTRANSSNRSLKPTWRLARP